MKNIYYLTKTVVTIPCLGLLPVGIYLVWLDFCRGDFSECALMAAFTVVYVWMIIKFVSPNVNPAFIKSAESNKKFFWVNFGITLFFTMILLIFGACLWLLLYPLFIWLGNDGFNLQMSDTFRTLWVYLCANTIFHFFYLLLWEHVRKYRWVRRLTIPNVCW